MAILDAPLLHLGDFLRRSCEREHGIVDAGFGFALVRTELPIRLPSICSR